MRIGRFADAIELYESAMQGPLGGSDPTLMKGLARARMLSGDGAAAEALFVKVKENDPAALRFRCRAGLCPRPGNAGQE